MDPRAHGRATPRTPGSGAPSRFALVDDEVEGAAVVAVLGELDIATAPELCVRLDAGRASNAPELLVDLTGLAFCDSTGLRALIGAANEYAVAGGELAVVPPAAGAVARLFALTGAAEFLPLYRSREDAVRARARG